ncbi:hypothetical protein EDD11_001423 [Mortierella claussenii]|nr:hypothetical protein EDD11_001423 [Mortierella claussenii]
MPGAIGISRLAAPRGPWSPSSCSSSSSMTLFRIYSPTTLESGSYRHYHLLSCSRSSMHQQQQPILPKILAKAGQRDGRIIQSIGTGTSDSGTGLRSARSLSTSTVLYKRRVGGTDASPLTTRKEALKRRKALLTFQRMKEELGQRRQSQQGLEEHQQLFRERIETVVVKSKLSTSSTSSLNATPVDGSVVKGSGKPAYVKAPSISAKEMVKAIESRRQVAVDSKSPGLGSGSTSESDGLLMGGVDPFGIKATDPFANQLQAAIDAAGSNANAIAAAAASGGGGGGGGGGSSSSDPPNIDGMSGSMNGGREKSTGRRSPDIEMPDIQARYLTGPAKWESVKARDVEIVNLTPNNRPKVAALEHGLDRVLFNPGVHWLQDPRSLVYNFDPYLRSICQPENFDYEALPEYKTSSRDQTLMTMAQKKKRKYVGSTSSTTSALSQYYFLISGWKPLKMGHLSEAFSSQPKGFTKLSRAPSTIQLVYKGNGIYAIDADKTFDTSTVLMQLGKSMEKMLTSTPEEFSRFTKKNSWQVTKQEREQPEAFNYIGVDNLLLRSQLDCEDPRLPGKTFDLKTRAAVAIRLDINNYELNKGYQLRKTHGYLESFEREYYDMMRSAFLKYSLQVRIGQMDGIFVAFHNTARIFGFQYISLDEMDSRLFGSTVMGDECFRNQLRLLNKTLDEVTAKYPQQDLKITLDTDEAIQSMNVWVETMPLGAASSERGKDVKVEFDEKGIPEMQPGAELSLWQIVCYSNLNNKSVVGPFDLSERGYDNWELRYKIGQLSKPHMMNEYRRMRAIQAEIFMGDEEREAALLAASRAAAAAAAASEASATGADADAISAASIAAVDALTAETIPKSSRETRALSRRDTMRNMLRRISEQGRIKQEEEERRQADKAFLIWEPKGYTKNSDISAAPAPAVPTKVVAAKIEEDAVPKVAGAAELLATSSKNSAAPELAETEQESPKAQAASDPEPVNESIVERMRRRLKEAAGKASLPAASETSLPAAGEAPLPAAAEAEKAAPNLWSQYEESLETSSAVTRTYYLQGRTSERVHLMMSDLPILQDMFLESAKQKSTLTPANYIQEMDEISSDDRYSDPTFLRRRREYLKKHHEWLCNSLTPFDDIRLKLMGLFSEEKEYSAMSRADLMRMSRLIGQPEWFQPDLMSTDSLRYAIYRRSFRFQRQLTLEYFHKYIHKVASLDKDAKPFKGIEDYLTITDEKALMRTAYGLNLSERRLRGFSRALGMRWHDAIKRVVLCQVYKAECWFQDKDLKQMGYYPRIFNRKEFESLWVETKDIEAKIDSLIILSKLRGEDKDKKASGQEEEGQKEEGRREDDDAGQRKDPASTVVEDWFGHDKALTKFGTLPILYEVSSDGKYTVEWAEALNIEIGLARKLGLLGDNYYEESQILGFFSNTRAVMHRHEDAYFAHRPFRTQDREVFFNTHLKQWIQRHEQALEQNGRRNGHYVGDKVTLADIKTAVALDALLNEQYVFKGFEETSRLITKELTPNLWRVREVVQSKRSYKDWLESPRYKDLVDETTVFFDREYDEK